MTRINYTEQLVSFEKYLKHEEKSSATVDKYMRDARQFLSFLSNYSEETEIGKEHTVAYKDYLAKQYVPAIDKYAVMKIKN